MDMMPGNINIAPETPEVNEFLRENFEKSLDSTELVLKEAQDIVFNLKNSPRQEYDLSQYKIRLLGLEQSLESLDELQSGNKYPELADRLNKTRKDFESMKLEFEAENLQQAA